jgi:hypothetical protein
MKRGTDQVFGHVGFIGEIDAGFFMLAQAQPYDCGPGMP